MKLKFKISFLLGVIIVCSLALMSQEPLDSGMIVGDWKVVVDVEGEHYYFTMTVEESENGLEGKISESTGIFTDVPLSDIQFDGKKFTFSFTSPTPPDGDEHEVKMEFEVGDNKLEGSFYIEELEISAVATATRKDG